MFLLAHGAKVNVKRKFDSNTPLHLAANFSDLKVVAETLLDKGADIDATNLDKL